jgi:hypothetical protein
MKTRLGTCLVLAALVSASGLKAQSLDVKLRPDVPAKRCGPLDYLLVPTLGIAPKCQERAAAADRKDVLALVADGKCQEAIAGALRIGDLQLAKGVREFCSPSPLGSAIQAPGAAPEARGSPNQ